MFSRYFIIIALLGFALSSPAVAQDNLGKKGRQDPGKSGGSSGSSGGSSQGRSSGGSMPPVRSGGNSGNTTPPTRGGGSGSSMPPVRSGGGGSSQGHGSSGSMPPVRGGSSGQDSGLGKGSRGNGSGSSSGSGGQGSMPPVRGGSTAGGTTSGRTVDLGKVTRGNSGNSTGADRSGSTILGRPDRAGSSGSGFGGYGTDHNLAKTKGTRTSGSVVSSDMPIVKSGSRIEREVNRENRIRIGDSRYRDGYYGYRNDWCDDNFFYPYYGFTYYDGCGFIPSPFYFYGHLPGYISCTRISLGFLTWTTCETRYSWHQPSYDRYGSYYDSRENLDYAVDDVRMSFEDRSIRGIASLIPSRGRIEIDVDGSNQYSLDSNDFFDMMRDLVENTYTRSYRIRDVYRDGSRASIEAIHEFEDAWGRTQCVRHTFGLREGRRGYEICYFRSSAR